MIDAGWLGARRDPGVMGDMHARKSRVLNKKVPMWTLIARKDNVAHAAVAAAVLPQDVRVRWYPRGGALPACTVPDDTIVLLEPPAGWEAGVAELVARHRKVWRFRGDMAAVDGTAELGDDVLHGLQYSLHAALIHPLNPNMKGVVLGRLRRKPSTTDGVLLVWLERALADVPDLTLRDVWRMNNAEWRDFTRCPTLRVTYDRMKACWGVKPRVVDSPKYGAVYAVAATAHIGDHFHCMELRQMAESLRIDFAVVVVPRMRQEDATTVHWRALDAPADVAAAWVTAHASQGGQWEGTFPVAGDHVAWLDDLGPSRLDRFLALLPF